MLAIILGVNSFYSMGFGSLEVIYRTLILFALEGENVSKGYADRLAIQWARIFAAITTISTFVNLIARLIYDRYILFLIGRCSNHVIVCELGALSQQLAKECRDTHKVVVIEANPTEQHLMFCRTHSLFLIGGDATDPEVLRQAGVQKADHIVFLCGNDAINLEVAARARSLVVTPEYPRHDKPLQIHIHLTDLALMQQIRMYQEFMRPDPDGSFRMLPFKDRNFNAIFQSIPCGVPKRSAWAVMYRREYAVKGC
jgi:K+ transport systems, NAD-binding component